ncbi:MAG: hypothetical protein IMF01_09580 [Proteobacteria bacterium]|nr:hypothetical protein [Pseudomonadota bacterium]
MNSHTTVKPTLISYHNGLDVIPFASVKAVLGDVIDDTNKITIAIDGFSESAILMGTSASDFIEQYNKYLRFIELGIMDERTPRRKALSH